MSVWDADLQQFIDDCAERRIADPRTALTDFAGIIDLAPPEFAELFESSITAERLDELCRVEAYLCAAVELVGPYCGILVTRSATGSASALVSISSEVEEGNFFGSDPAVTLLAACARALLLLKAAPRRH